ncbi:kelch-like protein 10 [Polypterus senegalus]|uniref:kelch-like protein 10 n=1 Tax=Polypterus senegalus TaxID=55291 RepID=UPI001962743A|nr:kelch-like protein 10 [Polypterus senegalus]
MMEMIITFAYTQRVPVTFENVEQLLAAADQLNILGTINFCSNFLDSQLSVKNCIGICKLAYCYSCLELHFKAFRFIVHNFEELVRVSEEFLQLSCFELCRIIERDELNVRNESHVFNAVMKWMYHKFAERKKFLADLLPKVRIILKDSSVFVSNVKKSEYMKDDPQYKLCAYRCLLQMIYDLGINDSATPHHSSPKTSTRLPYNILLSIGGWRDSHPTNAIEVYDTRAKSWTDVMCLEETPRAYHGTAFVLGYIYLIGGCDRVKYYNRVCRFDPVRKVWQEVAPTHSRRCYISVVVLNNFIYAMGGFDGLNRLSTAEKYNSETNQWTLLSSMNERRSDASATTLHGKIYICGGFSGEDYLFTAEVYDPSMNQWTMIPPMMIQRSGVGVVAYKDEIYAVGGFDGENRLETAEAFNPQTGTWRSIASMITPRSNFGIETMEDLLYAVGGYDGHTTSSKVECYNKETNEWKEVPNMTIDRSALSCCVLSGLPNIREYVISRVSPEAVTQSEESRMSPFYNIPPL